MPIEIIFFLIILFFSIVIHEYAHGWVAYKLGDSTAKDAGRLTLNPIKHIDPVGTIFLPGILLILIYLGNNITPIGWAKPVPVNFTRLRNPKKDMMLIAIAGPAINIFLAGILSLVLRYPLPENVHLLLTIAVYINIGLAVFNMIPMPPLDGSRIVMGLLPNKWVLPYARLERFGILIIIVLINIQGFQDGVLSGISFLAGLLGVSLK